MRTLIRSFVLGLCAAIASCGGGSIGNGTNTPPVDPGPVPTSLTLLVSSPNLSSDASNAADGVTLTAIVKDEHNNVIPSITVTFSTADSGAITVTQGQTDASGVATAILTTGGDPQNRDIHVTASAGLLSQTITVTVVGTTLAISGPDATQFGTDTTYQILLTDAAGNGIGGKPVTVTSNPGNTITAASLVTDSGGLVNVTLTARTANSFLTATSLGLTTTKDIAVSTDQFTFLTPAEDKEINIGANQAVTVRWLQNGVAVPNGTVINFTITRGTLSAPSAVTAGGNATVTISSTESGFSLITASSSALSHPTITSSVEFVATTPQNIDVQASPSTIATNSATDVRTTVRDPANNLVKNAVVDFSLSDPTAGSISAGTAVTNSQGVATIRYSSTSQASPTNGVRITGTIRKNGTCPAPPPLGPPADNEVLDPSVCDRAKVTVSANAVDITIGTGGTIFIIDESTYGMPYSVIVSDSNGNPVSNAEFRLQIQSDQYVKGTRDGDGGIFVSAICDNEDVNLNDIMDPSEDTNTNGILDPGRPATVPATIPIDADGHGQFNVIYPKEYGQFLFVNIIGTVLVSGTESTERRNHVLLPIADADKSTLPLNSAFGIKNKCSNPN